MAKFSELTEITSITDSDLMMITDAETSASRKITWANVKASTEASSVVGPVNFTAQADVALSRGDVVYISGCIRRHTKSGFSSGKFIINYACLWSGI